MTTLTINMIFFEENDISINSDETNIRDIEHEYWYSKNTHFVIKCFPFSLSSQRQQIIIQNENIIVNYIGIHRTFP